MGNKSKTSNRPARLRRIRALLAATGSDQADKPIPTKRRWRYLRDLGNAQLPRLGRLWMGLQAAPVIGTVAKLGERGRKERVPMPFNRMAWNGSKWVRVEAA